MSKWKSKLNLGSEFSLYLCKSTNILHYILEFASKQETGRNRRPERVVTRRERRRTRHKEMISASILPNCLFIKQLNRLQTKLFGNNQIFIFIFSCILPTTLPPPFFIPLSHKLLLLKIHHIIKTEQRKVTARALSMFLFISVAYLSFSIFAMFSLCS